MTPTADDRSSTWRTRRSDEVLVRRPGELTTAWAQAVLDGTASRARVTDVHRTLVDVGTTTRVRLTVDHDGDTTLARRWFVKLPSASLRARAVVDMVRLPQQEVHFYQRLAAVLAPACTTALAACSRAAGGFTLVLPDLEESGATTSTPADRLSVDRAAAVVDTLADIHARGQTLVRGFAAWLDRRRWIEDTGGAMLSIPLVRRGLSRAGDAVAETLHAPLHRYARRRRAVMRELRGTGPATLVHHDCHPGNLFWRGDTPGLLDWQLVRCGDGVGDVAYFLACSLDPKDRAEHEHALLDQYAAALSARGAIDPLDDRWLRYRKHLTYALEAMLVTLAIGGFVADADARELVRRTAIAAAENEAFDALAAMGR